MATIEGTKKKLTVKGELIESAVNSKHEHSNKGVLDKLSDNNGTLQYNGADITGGGGSYTLPTASTTELGGVKVDGSTITINSDGIITSNVEINEDTLSGKIADYLDTNGVTVSRYGFTNDLLVNDKDNSIVWDFTSDRKGHLIFCYDLGEVLTKPTLKFEFIYDKADNVTLTNCQIQGMGATHTTTTGTQSLGFSTTNNRAVNVKHSFTVSSNGTGRYVKIIFNFSKVNTSIETGNIINIKVAKLYANGNLAKFYEVNSNNVAYGSESDYYNDDRIMNYGAYKAAESKKDKYKGMRILCCGDSTTNGNNGATTGLGFPTHLAKYFPQCSVTNHGWNGIDANGFFTTVTSATNVPDWNNVVAVLAAYGANASGGYNESDIPNTRQYIYSDARTANIQIDRSVEDAIGEVTYTVDGTNFVVSDDTVEIGAAKSNPQTYTIDGVNCIYDSVANTITIKGFYFNDSWIDTEEKYWSLFGTGWYGKMAKGIEYVQFMNPFTTLALHSYHHLSYADSTQAEDIETYMLKLQDIYRIPVIKANKELGVNNKTYRNMRLDWAHMNDLGNECKGWYLAKQLDTYIKYPYIYDHTYKYNDLVVTSLAMNRTTETVKVGEDIYLYVRVAPYNAISKDVIWSSDNENVTITPIVKGLEWQKVKVSGVSVGTSVITCTAANDPSITATCTVNITADSIIPVTGVTFDESTYNVVKGESATVSYTIEPGDATNKNATITANNGNVSVNGKVVTGVAVGTSVLTVTTADGSYTATTTVTVEDAPDVAVTGVTIDETATVEVDKTTQLKYTVSPTNATNKTVTFSVDNSNCTVSDTGLITGVAEGSSKITITTDDGGYTASCIVTITAASTGEGELSEPTVYSLANGNFITGRIDNSTGEIDTTNTSYMQNATAIPVSGGEYYFVSYDTAPSYFYAHFWSDAEYLSSINIKSSGLGFPIPAGCTKLYIICTNGANVINVYNATNYIVGSVVVGDSATVDLVNADATSKGYVGYATAATSFIPRYDLIVEPGLSYTYTVNFLEGTTGSVSSSAVREYVEGSYLSYQNATVYSNTFTAGATTHHVRIKINNSGSSTASPVSLTITKNS